MQKAGRVILLRERCAQHQKGAQQNQGGDLQTRLGGMQLQEVCRAKWGRGMCKPVEDQSDPRCKSKKREAEVCADLGGMCKPKLGSLQSRGEDSYQLKERSCANHLGGLQAPKGVGTSEGPCREERPCEWACKPWQGRAGKAGCARKGWGALPVAWPWPRPRQGVPAGGPQHRAWDICPVGGGPHLLCPAP